MTLARAADELGWPEEHLIFAPPGAGPAVNVALAQRKIGQTIRTLEGAQDAKIGVLSANPRGNESEAPLALVCAFPNPAPSSTIAEVHRLSWNFSRTPLLLTVDTNTLRAFSCCEPPSCEQSVHELPSELTEASYCFTKTDRNTLGMEDQASQALHWLEIVSGRLIKQYEQKFTSRNRADVLLLHNLRFVRDALHGTGLEYDIIHDLLARVIFIQFLFDRRDSDGHTALNADHLARLHHSGVLSESYQCFSEILANHADCYRLFWHLDDHFNGDLFPRAAGESGERLKARHEEKNTIKPVHLALLSQFVSGRLMMESGQYSLWPSYSFDIIPLEFISSIYESFVSKKPGTVYTPTHLVDFVLDEVLPWGGTAWNLRILDPACGSGIFLVKAFQRLIHRWKSAHPKERIKSAVLRSLLESNLFGVDNDPHAVRTASFSLYLAMCDEIEPRQYWKQVKFPSMRDHNLLSQDFFDEGSTGVRSKEDNGTYDIIVGNAPWGQNTATSPARIWAKEHNWPISYGDIGPLFLAKSAKLSKKDGLVSLFQPAGTLLFNHSTHARLTREKLFRENIVNEIVNFSALRFGLFRDAVGPAVLVTLRPAPATAEPILYISPKPVRHSGSDDYRIIIDPYDIHEVDPQEAVSSPFVWSALIWGGRRDVRLLELLSSHTTLGKLKSRGLVNTRRGIIRGKDQRVKQPRLLGMRILEADDFPKNVFLTLSPSGLKINDNPYTYVRDSRRIEAFMPAQLIIKMAWTVEDMRFKAVVVRPATEGVLCSRHYVSVQAAPKNKGLLDAACLSYNSSVATYYLFLRSGRFANYRPEPYVWELLDVPIPKISKQSIDSISSTDQLNSTVEDSLELRPAERVLVEDALKYALPDFKGSLASPGRSPTPRCRECGEASMLEEYCEWFLRVLRAGFGEKREVCATIFVENTENYLPARLVAFHFEVARKPSVVEEHISLPSLVERIGRVFRLLTTDDHAGVIGYRRVARVFDEWQMDGNNVPTVMFIKPDETRYWTRSMAMRDADDVSREILQRMQGKSLASASSKKA